MRVLELDWQDIFQGEQTELPPIESVKSWIQLTLDAVNFTHHSAELTVRVVGEDESHELNSQYRNKQGATNVLSFPFEAPAQIECDLLGDLVICQPVVKREAIEQDKTLQSHWAHMIVHGTLHLLGFDHIEVDDAEIMEQIEITVLDKCGFDNPYVQDSDK